MITILETHRTFISEELVQIQKKDLWYNFEEFNKSARLDNEVFTNKDKIDNDEVDKYKAKSHIIASFVILRLQLPSFLA